MTQAKRYDWADFMKGIMMFLVILYHSEVYYGYGHTWSWTFEPFFLSGFFFISGFLFAKDILEVNFEKKLKQVFRTIIFPYFIFVSALALPKVLLGHANVQQIMIDIIMLRASWFVIAIAVMQLMYTAILSIKPTVRNIIVSTSVMVMIGYAFVVIYRDCPMWLIENSWLYSNELPNKLPACLNLALTQSPFFALGMLLRYYTNKVYKHNLYLVVAGGGKTLLISVLAYLISYIWLDHKYIGSSVSVSTDQYDNIILIYVYGVIGVLALMCFSNKIQCVAAINYIGRYSLLFYFLNGGVLTVISPLFRKLSFMDSNIYVNQILVAVIATAFMFPCVWFINKYLPILTGNKDRFNKLSQKMGLKIHW